MVPLELGDELRPLAGEGDKGGAAVGWMTLACHEVIRNECIHKASNGPGGHPQCFGKDMLGYRATLAQLPKQMGARQSEAESSDPLSHVVVQHQHELENTVEQVFILLYSGDSELW